MRYQFVDDNRTNWPVNRMCRVLELSQSGYYAWRKRPASPQKMANEVLLEKIETAYQNSYGTYGSPRIFEELREEEVDCSENRIARLMRQHDIVAIQEKRYKRTTRANPAHPVVPNRLGRDFKATAPNQKWTVDITYIETLEGWLYLAVVLDLFSRRIVGWAMSNRMTTQLAVDALQMAILQRRPDSGLLHHSDRGSQYTAHAYQQILQTNSFQPSMSRTGNCYDNAPSESFFGTLKNERVHHIIYKTRAEARSDIFAYIEGFYNRRRRHSSLGYLSPSSFEANWLQSNPHQSTLTGTLH